MRPETEKRVEDLLNRAKAAKAELDEAKERFGSNGDQYLHQQIKQASVWLGDVEVHFVGQLREDRSPPRSLAEESNILAFAESHLNDITLPLVRTISEWSKTHGSKFQSIG